uniref:glutathione-specific gamma-glutamylcyclotransferase n=1 Tax=Cannabis sativa TaxID=3483 RepID=A0A803PZ49_CANSA
MAMWVFGYGSLVWKAGFNFDERLVGFIKGYRRVFYQGSTDHRGTPEFPGRTVTLEPADPHEVCWGAAYKITKKEEQEIALTHLEVREKQYDKKAYVDFFTEPLATTPTVSGVMIYCFSRQESQCELLGPSFHSRYCQANCSSRRPLGTQQRLPISARKGSSSNWM